MTTPDLVHYHAPNTRSMAIRWLTKELGIVPELRVLDLAKGEHKRPDYLAINPLGKVPAIVHRGVVVTEAPAIAVYLADAFPAAGLAPAADDPARGRYLRAMFFYSGAVEPAAIDKALKREADRPSIMSYGRYEDMIAGLLDIVGAGPFILGEQFTAADVIVGGGISWLLQFQLLPARDELVGYSERVTQRLAYVETVAAEQALAAGMAG